MIVNICVFFYGINLGNILSKVPTYVGQELKLGKSKSGTSTPICDSFEKKLRFHGRRDMFNSLEPHNLGLDACI
jgi:hypothetical protein